MEASVSSITAGSIKGESCWRIWKFIGTIVFSMDIAPLTLVALTVVPTPTKSSCGERVDAMNAFMSDVSPV